MVNNIKEYYTVLEKTRTDIQDAIGKIEAIDADELDIENYSEILSRLYIALNATEQMLNVHKFLRISKENFIARETGRGRVEKKHIVKEFETPMGIAAKYGITLDELLKKNNITTSEITKGRELIIELEPSSELLKVYESVPTYGEQTGELLYGMDAAKQLTLESGDIKVLPPEETLKQGLNNRINTRPGDYPLEEDFGLELLVGTDYPKDLILSMGVVKIHKQLLRDKRVKAVKRISADFTNNAIVFSGEITTLENNNLEL